jgi:hypothetical protein
MSTTLQLYHRLTRKLRTRDLSAYLAHEKLEIMDAAQEGLTAYLKLIGPERKQSPVSESLRAPVDLTIDILTGAKGFSYVAGSPFPVGGYTLEENLVGHSVYVTGDRNLNRLQSTGSLLSACLGSSGQVTATFYGDVVQHGQDDRRIIDSPRWFNGSSERALTHAPLPSQRWPSYPFIVAQTICIGTPEFWWTEPLLGYDRVTTPTWVMRVWPLPAETGVLVYSKEAFPAALTLEDFTTPRDLPVHEREFPYLLNLCEEALLGSDLFREKATLSTIPGAANRARAALTSDQQPHHSEPNSIGTPEGW